MTRRACGRATRIAAPIVFLILASTSVFAHFQIISSGTDSSSSTATPLAVGVFLSDHDSSALHALQMDGGAAPPGWHVEVTGTNDGTARVTANYGQIALDQSGMEYASGGNRTLGGPLGHPVTLVYTLPPRAVLKQTRIVTLTPGMRDPSFCASWNDAKGKNVVVKTAWDRGSDGWPDVAICRIPAFVNARNIDIYLASDVDVPSMRESFSGKSSLSVSNPQTLITTMDQQDVPEPLLNSPSRPYELHLYPPKGRSLSAIQPPADGAGPLGARAWKVAAGGFVATDLTDGRKQNVAEVMEQVLLILAGFFFGLFASTLPAAARALTTNQPEHATSASRGD